MPDPTQDARRADDARLLSAGLAGEHTATRYAFTDRATGAPRPGRDAAQDRVQAFDGSTPVGPAFRGRDVTQAVRMDVLGVAALALGVRGPEPARSVAHRGRRGLVRPVHVVSITGPSAATLDALTAWIEAQGGPAAVRHDLASAPVAEARRLGLL